MQLEFVPGKGPQDFIDSYKEIEQTSTFNVILSNEAVSMSHLSRWIDSMMVSLDSEVDKKKREKILENCGRNCISRDLIKKAQACRKSARNMDEFLDRLAKNWSHLQRNGKKVHVVYEKCYCPLLRGHSGALSKTFCNCSRGYIMELFESALQTPVQVTLEKSIRHGDNICRFEVHLPNSLKM